MATAPLRGIPIFTVHATRPDDVGPVEIVFDDEHAARAYAQERSHDRRVLSVSVTRFTIGELGTRHPVAWYVDGAEQPRHYNRQICPSDSNDHALDRRQQRPRPRSGGTSPCANN